MPSGGSRATAVKSFHDTRWASGRRFDPEIADAGPWLRARSERRQVRRRGIVAPIWVRTVAPASWLGRSCRVRRMAAARTDGCRGWIKPMGAIGGPGGEAGADDRE